MKEYTINLFVEKQFIRTYTTSFVPMVGDMISLSDNEIFTVEKRMLPANNTSNVILLFGNKS
jgi:hypothetical protein